MHYLMTYNHSMTDGEATARGLPVEVAAIITEDRSGGLSGDRFRPWQTARNNESVPPEDMFMFIDQPEWTIDFFTIYGGVIASERMLALFNANCPDDIYISTLTVIDKNDQELPQTLYFVKFVNVADVVDFDLMDFGGASHDIVGGANNITEDEQGLPIIARAAQIVFLPHAPAVFLEKNLPELAPPIFCSDAFKDECERTGLRGPWFWQQDEVLVVDFRPTIDGGLEDWPPQLIALQQRLKWISQVDRSQFIHSENVRLSDAHETILRRAAARMKDRRRTSI